MCAEGWNAKNDRALPELSAFTSYRSFGLQWIAHAEATAWPASG